MALTGDLLVDRRGGPASRNEFGYPVKAGEKVYRGGLVALNSSGQIVRVQTSGALVVLGVADRTLDNSASSAVSVDLVTPMKGTWKLPVSGATVSNIGQPVYATDDNTLALGSPSTLSGVLTHGTNVGTYSIPGSGAGSLSISAGAKLGAYVGVVLSGAATYSFTDPNGDALPTGTLGSAYAGGDLAFTLSGGGTPTAGDTFTLTISGSPVGGLLAGTLAGIENGATFVNIAGT